MLRIDDTRIKIISQSNFGVSVARNVGTEAAKYEWIAYLDADDEWDQDYLSTINIMIDKYPGCSVLSTAYYRVFREERAQYVLPKRLLFDGVDGIIPNYFQVCAFSSPPVTSSSIVVKKSTIKEIGGFPQNVITGEEIITWSSLALISPFAFSKKPLVNIHIDLSRPFRIPQVPDYVGRELINLIHIAPTHRVRWIKKYLAKWHKIRAHSYLVLNKREHSLNEIHTSIWFNPFSKVWFFIPFLFLPNRIFRLVNKIRN